MRDIVELTRAAGGFEPTPAFLERLVALARADEREACAKVCDEESSSLGGVAEGPFVTDFGKHTHMSMAAGAQNCAAAIRARGETK
jgi:hypothetical protein